MRKEVLRKQFFQYIIPSMFAMLLSGFYAIIDGLFVGNAAGDAALGAINLVWPLQCVINATAMGLGVGSAVLMSTYLGEGETQQAHHACAMGIMMLVIAGLVLPMLILFWLPQLLHFFGAQGELYTLCHEYIIIILIGGIFPVIGNGVNPLLRNRGNTMSATILMCSGLVTNIILDYLLVVVLQVGLAGAAIATIIAQAVVACLSMIFLWKTERALFQRKHFHFRSSEVKKILHIGISPFGQTLVPSLVILFTNWKCIAYGGNDAVTIFSVVSYVLSTVQLLLQGIGDGVQPLFSFYYGAKKPQEVTWLYRHALLLSLITSALFMAVVIGLAQELMMMFGLPEYLRISGMDALRMSAFAFMTLGVARLTCSYFYATGAHKASTLLVYIEPCLLLPLILQLCSEWLGMEGVWLSYPLVQFLLCGAAILMKYRMGKEPNIELVLDRK